MSGSTRTPSAAGPVLHTDRKLGPCLKDGAVEWPPSPRQCSACALFSYVRSAILTDERFLHFQLRRDTGPTCNGTVDLQIVGFLQLGIQGVGPIPSIPPVLPGEISAVVLNVSGCDPSNPG